jgi:acyl-ACP thioesterase
LDELYEKNGEAVDMNDVAASVDLDREEVMRRCKDIVDQFEYDKKIKVLHKYPSDESDSEEIIVDHRGRVRQAHDSCCRIPLIIRC